MKFSPFSLPLSIFFRVPVNNEKRKIRFSTPSKRNILRSMDVFEKIKLYDDGMGFRNNSRLQTFECHTKNCLERAWLFEMLVTNSLGNCTVGIVTENPIMGIPL